MSASFPENARTLMIGMATIPSARSREEYCALHNIKYNGALVNRGILQAAKMFETYIMDTQAHNLLLEI